LGAVGDETFVPGDIAVENAVRADAGIITAAMNVQPFSIRSDIEKITGIAAIPM